MRPARGAGSRSRAVAAACAFACALAGAGAAQARNLPGGGEATGYRFQIVTGDDSELTHRIAQDLSKRLVPIFTVFRTELAQKRRMLLVAIGPVALRDAAARECDCAVIAAYTSSQVWRAVMAGVPSRRAASMTAVYAEPAPADQLRLVELLYRRPVRIAAIVGSHTGFLAPELRGEAEVVPFGAGDDINRTLARIAKADVLLALPDSGVYHTENVRNILLSTYRSSQAVIGFSADMVKVGALASTCSGIEDIDAQLAEIAASFVASNVLPAPQFPRYFSTIVNDGVARSLGVKVDAAARGFARHPQAARP